MINLKTGELEEYDISVLEIKQSKNEKHTYFSVYQLRIKGDSEYGRINYTTPELFATKEACEKYWKTEVEPKLISKWENQEPGFAFSINTSKKYESIIEERKVFIE